MRSWIASVRYNPIAISPAIKGRYVLNFSLKQLNNLTVRFYPRVIVFYVVLYASEKITNLCCDLQWNNYFLAEAKSISTSKLQVNNFGTNCELVKLFLCLNWHLYISSLDRSLFGNYQLVLELTAGIVVNWLLWLCCFICVGSGSSDSLPVCLAFRDI